ncbi:MAG: tetratricopeptide repeat protein [Magnetovibrionaceae bacterium]
MSRQAEQLIDKAHRLHKAGDLDGAEPLYAQAQALAPHLADPPHLLGLIAFQKGDLAQAERWMRDALSRAPGEASILSNLGLVLSAAGDWPAAAKVYGELTLEDGAAAEAFIGLGRALCELDRLPAAEAAFGRALRLQPVAPEAHLGRARCLKRRAALDEAEMAVRTGLKGSPGHAGLNAQLGLILSEQGRKAEALAAFDQVETDDPALSFNRARALIDLNLTSEGVALLAQVRGRAPAYHFRCLYAEALSRPLIYESEDQIEEEAARGMAALERLGGGLDLSTPSRVLDARSALSELPNFLSPYSGLDVTAYQSLVGEIAGKVSAAAFPGLAEAPTPRQRSGRCRIGFASAYLHMHTMLKLFGAWMVEADQNRFEVHAIHLGRRVDAATEALRQRVSLHGPFVSAKEAARAIRDLDLDLLVYLDVGMAPRSLLLAALPLCREQAVAMGHPVTTGLASIGSFLSSAGMEPEGAEAHYTEQLVKLPGLSFYYPRPPSIALTKPSDGKVHLVCPQSLFKILPRHDRLFAEIAAQAGPAHFHFIAHGEPAVSQAFYQRLRAAFQARGVAPDGRLTLHPRQDQAGFFSLVGRADILLDTPDWSGCNTTLEALSGVAPPVPVTLTGTYLRGRHTTAILNSIGLGGLVSVDEAGYVDRVLGLIEDKEKRRDLSAQIQGRSQALFTNPEALACFYDWAEGP